MDNRGVSLFFTKLLSFPLLSEHLKKSKAEEKESEVE